MALLYPADYERDFEGDEGMEEEEGTADEEQGPEEEEVANSTPAGLSGRTPPAAWGPPCAQFFFERKLPD